MDRFLEVRKDITITMPYMPEDKPYEIYIQNFLVDPKNGEYDTIKIMYAITPEGTKIPIERCFKKCEDSFIEIGQPEYEKRKEIAHERKIE